MPQLIPSFTIRVSLQQGEYQTSVEQINHFSFPAENNKFLQVNGSSVDQVQETFKAAVKKLQLGRKLPKQIGFTFVLSVHDLGKNRTTA